MLPFILSWDNSPIKNEIRDREFYCSIDYELHFRLGISNCTSVWSADKLG